MVAGSFFITITRKEGDQLFHYQAKVDFSEDDCLPSLDEIRKLVEKELPTATRVRPLAERRFQ